MKSVFFASAAALFLAGPARAGDESLARYAAAYLLKPTSARALGMGNAFTAVANDTQAIYYNPAGLGFLRYSGFGSVYSPQGYDQVTWSAEYVQATAGYGGFGAGLIMNEIGGIEGRADEFAPPSEIKSREGAALLSYGYAPGPNWSVGATGKYLFHRFTNVSDNARGAAFDLGAKWFSQDRLPGLVLGLAAQNLGGRLRWSSGRSDPLLRLVKAGAAYKAAPFAVAVLDGEFREDGGARFHAGLEFSRSHLALRLGADHDRPTCGVSFTSPKMLAWFRVDYGFELDPSGLEDVHRLGLSARF